MKERFRLAHAIEDAIWYNQNDSKGKKDWNHLKQPEITVLIFDFPMAKFFNEYDAAWYAMKLGIDSSIELRESGEWQ